MSRWDNLGKKEQPQRRYDQVPVEGEFQCQVCGVYVPAAVYLPQEKLLTYKCLEGHKSFIEKFSV